MNALRPFTTDAVEGIRMEQTSRGLHIERAWRRGSGYILLVWVAVWLGIVRFFTSLGGHRDVEFTAWMSMPGVIMAYVALTRFVNRTVIDISPSDIALRHEPLPWPGRRRLAISEIAAVHIRQKTMYYRGGRSVECWISLERKNGTTSMLVKGLEMSVPQMYSIAGAVAGFLGVPVHGD
jgi:hypothetical protein